MNPEVDKYLIEGCYRCPFGGTPQCKVNNWTQELKLLRTILLSTPLNEELKWKIPTYTFQGQNVLMLAAFKDYAAISFFKGSLLLDSKGILTKPGENTQSARIIKFTNVSEILQLESVIKKYIYEAIENEKNGTKVSFKNIAEHAIPTEFQTKLNNNAALKKAFESLTPGRQRGYLLYFASAKQAKTRETRIEKCVANILCGKGMDN